MKKLILSICAILMIGGVRADEGMWVPMLIGKNYEDMKRLGLKLSQEDLYSINQSSLKDAIVQFGGGCTAEMISTNGLLFTNHHCGYDAIAQLSSVEKNYLDNGFWAYRFSEELPVPGLSVIFLQRMEDVTATVKAAIGNATGDEYTAAYRKVSKKLEQRFSENGKYIVQVREFFNGNQVLMMLYKRYTDVRLAGTPPKSLGKYGGDTDNWMWPRHTADFAMFRVYAGSDNEPAAYSPANKPYRPKHYLPVSIKGVEEGDFAMIFGYPGRTNRYEVSYGVAQALQEVNPSIVKLREKRLEIMDHYMNQDKAVYLKLTSQKQRISNYWKYYIGQTAQLSRLQIVAKKRKEEQAFTRWAQQEAPAYAGLTKAFKDAYAGYAPYAKHQTYYGEGFRAPALTRFAAAFEPLTKALRKGEQDKDSLDKYIKALKRSHKVLMNDFHEGIDKDVFAAVTEMFYTDVDKVQHPSIYEETILQKFGATNKGADFAAYADYVYKNSFLTDSILLQAFFDNPTLEQLNADPAIQYASSFVSNYTQHYKPGIDAFRHKKAELSKDYIRGLMAMKGKRRFYPDANSTMRISYGQVLSYYPQDAVHYDYYTTIDGLMAKYKAGDEEFDLPKSFIDLYKKNDYGRYADEDGNLRTCFITNNDITGGNSGSAILNAKGEITGLAFDGNWEAMSGDIAFDKTYKRTIAVDVRFILFIIEKMGKAHNLIAEMDLRTR